MDWVVTLNRAIEYIEQNLLDEITCETIANHVYISNAHLQKGFHALAGLTMNEYIRNRRLTLAGYELLQCNEKVIDIAMKYGYETPESFSKAFSRFHNIAPSQAKRNGANLKSYSRLIIKIIMEGGSVMNYRIEKKDAFSVIVRTTSIGNDPANECSACWCKFFEQGFAEKVTPIFGISKNMLPGKKTFEYGIGNYETSVKEIPADFEKWIIPENTWAVFECKGPLPKSIQDMFGRIYSEWLPKAEFETFPTLEIEYYTDGDTDSSDYRSEIWIPIKEK
jgi:AraC family transcriptional regulator